MFFSVRFGKKGSKLEPTSKFIDTKLGKYMGRYGVFTAMERGEYTGATWGEKNNMPL